MMRGNDPMSRRSHEVWREQDRMSFPSCTAIEDLSLFRANVVRPVIQKTYGLMPIMDARVRGHDIRSDEAFI